VADRFVDIGGIVKYHSLNDDLDILVILFSCTAYVFRDSVVINLILSSYTTYIHLILSSYTTYIDLILSSYTKSMGLIMSFYTTY